MNVETSQCGVSTCFIWYSVNKRVIRRKFFGDYGDYSPKMFIFAKNLKCETTISEMMVSHKAKGEL